MCGISQPWLRPTFGKAPALGRVLARTIRPGLIFEFLHRNRPAEQIALCEVHSEPSQQLERVVRLRTNDLSILILSNGNAVRQLSDE